MNQNRILAMLKEHRYIIILLFALFVERLFALHILGLDYVINSDDIGYIGSGIRLFQTGVVGIYSDQPSAMIMPGLPALLSVMTGLFGYEELYWFSVKLLWICMGVCTAYVVYRSVILLAPKYCGLLAAAAFLSPNIVWMDNLIMTETPYFLLFTCTVFCTLAMGKYDQKKYFWGYVISFILALELRPTIAVMPIFTALYLLLKKKDKKMLLKRGAVLVIAAMLFIVPWTVRNYIHFDSFIPLTYGADNPMLLGTYQGIGYPTDEELDYETNVEQVWRERYAEYLDEEGNIIDPVNEQRLVLAKDGVKAAYRMKTWFATNPLSMLASYFVIKPAAMVVVPFSWVDLFGIPRNAIAAVRMIDLILCCIAVVLAIRYKKYREEIAFLAVSYWGYIYMIAMAYSFSRYGETLMSLRYILVGIGISLLAGCWKKRKEAKTTE